jgi:hypothetical protein
VHAYGTYRHAKVFPDCAAIAFRSKSCLPEFGVHTMNMFYIIGVAVVVVVVAGFLGLHV